MKPELQRITLALLGGWTPNDIIKDKSREEMAEAIMCWIPPQSNFWQSRMLPDYLNDLNEIHKLENELFDTGDIHNPNHARYAYSRELYNLVPGIRQPMRATAKHRAEAILRAFNLYED